jgi:haloalkane dehalogenase
MTKTNLSEADVAGAFRAGPHDTIAVPGGRLAAWRFGRGPDVVAVHGWPLHGATFRRIVPRLAERFTVHVVDLPGTGCTEWAPEARCGFLELAATVRAFVDARGLSRFAYLAHDSGAAIARFAAEDDPRVAGLVMGNTEIPGHTPWFVALLVALAKMPGGSAAFLASMRLGVLRRSALGFGGCFRDPSYVDGDFGDWFVRPLLSSGAVAAGQLRLVHALDLGVLARLPEVHARIRAPALAVWGTDDTFFPLELARPMMNEFGGPASLVEIPGARLFAHEDHPDAFVDACLPFLERCFAEAAPRADRVA